MPAKTLQHKSNINRDNCILLPNTDNIEHFIFSKIVNLAEGIELVYLLSRLIVFSFCNMGCLVLNKAVNYSALYVYGHATDVCAAGITNPISFSNCSVHTETCHTSINKCLICFQILYQ